MTTTLTTKEKKLIVLSVIMGATIIGLTIGIIHATQESTKYSTILDMACNYAYDKAGCKQGMKLLKNMPIEEIKDLGK